MTIIFDLPVLEQLYEDAYDIYLSNNKQTSLCKSTSRVEVLFGGGARRALWFKGPVKFVVRADCAVRVIIHKSLTAAEKGVLQSGLLHWKIPKKKRELQIRNQVPSTKYQIKKKKSTTTTSCCDVRFNQLGDNRNNLKGISCYVTGSGTVTFSFLCVPHILPNRLSVYCKTQYSGCPTLLCVRGLWGRIVYTFM